MFAVIKTGGKQYKVAMNDVILVEKLEVEAGADVNAKSTGGRTPLSLARKARADETAGIISLWVLKGCKPGKPC